MAKKKKGNVIEIQGYITAIYTGNGATTIIDTEDLKLLEGYTVEYHKRTGYFYIIKDKKKVYLHRLINNTTEGMVTDHINRDKADNRKINLRTCTYLENNLNKDNVLDELNHVEGISYHTRRKKWQVFIKQEYIGIFSSRQEAIRAKALAEKYHAETPKMDSKLIEPKAIQRQRLWQIN